MMGLVACGANSGTTTVNDDPATIRSAPAGIATLGFLDIEGSIRPTALPASVTPSAQAPATGASCITSSQKLYVTTYTFTNCVSANAGTLNGTIIATGSLSGSSLVFTEVLNLTSALDATHSWQYTGTQTVTVTGDTATVTAAAATAIQAVYTDTGTPANNKTFTFMPMLSMNWVPGGTFNLDGSYTFTQSAGPSIGEVISVTMDPSTPLAWTSGCGYPGSGTMSLALSNSPAGNAAATAVFGPACGTVAIDGASITVGGN